MSKLFNRAAFVVAAVAMAASPLSAQIQTVDPNSAIDADLSSPPATSDGTYYDNQSAPVDTSTTYDTDPVAPQNAPLSPASNGAAATGAAPATGPAPAIPAQAATFKRDDLIGAAEGVFGKGAEGLAGIIENILKDQGEPNAYIAGREASGAFVVGLRYGSGTLFHNIEGQRAAYWTGPSLGFDVGGNAANTFVLVYNLYDTQDLYKRFPAGEGNAYFVGGFTASYLRSGDVVLIPIRLGVGYRLGANVGYMKFSEKQTWMPF
jgi:hypothetical protein